MRRIAIVSEHASPLALAGSVDSGGQNIYVAQIARHFARMGHQVDVYTRADSPRLPAEVTWEDGVRVIHVPAGPAREIPKEQLLPYMDQFGDFLMRHFARPERRYDIVHANFFMSALAALPAARACGIPIAVTFHALGRVRRQFQKEADLFPERRFDIEDDIIARADRIIAECPQDKQDMVTLYGADPRRLSIVPCGYDPAEMLPMDRIRARAELGWNDNRFTLLQLGRMVPRKGVDNVIRALGRLRRRHGIDARLCVVGGNSATPSESATPELARLRAVAREEGVLQHVEFTGRRDRLQLRAYYCASDVFVTTPWYEPFGITPLEAMACARPVVGSDTGGIRFSVRHGETGWLVPPKEPDALADRLAMLARDSLLRHRMGEAGLQRARRYFTWPCVSRQLMDVFEEIMAPAILPDVAPAPAAAAARAIA
ncbi:glycosyl transferase family 1 [Bordetella genomosp. 8]|uniref:Glycosyl transferase family 1 n=1 Tax=Bordetella genomosp. 8 TaxID=1416806 RepID=A0A1W6YQN1_9BORD|nr:glycosyltransferase [Bordetella genomosp. 8]ARP83395.1 glycosyl transferase family 1 [Bordetella genomosp. 8]